MNKLEVRFATFIEDFGIEQICRKHGPVFHRWLPNGRNDALTIEDHENQVSVELWFERKGFMDNGYIRYKQDKNEIDESIIPLQAILEGGPLFGAVTFQDAPQMEFESVINDNKDSKDYISIGKRVIKDYVDPLIIKLTRLLRDNDGQYWIQVPSGFDSRELTLGAYCNNLNMKWKTANGQKGSFIPTKDITQTLSYAAEMGSIPYNDYINEARWYEIEEHLRSEYTPSTSITIATRANKYLDQGDFEHALTECIISLEISIEEYVRKKIYDSGLIEASQSFWQQPLISRTTLVGALAGISKGAIQSTLNAIKDRNQYIHEGKQPTYDSEDHIKAVLSFIKGLSDYPKPKYPTINPQNQLVQSEADWEYWYNSK